MCGVRSEASGRGWSGFWPVFLAEVHIGLTAARTGSCRILGLSWALTGAALKLPWNRALFGLSLILSCRRPRSGTFLGMLLNPMLICDEITGQHNIRPQEGLCWKEEDDEVKQRMKDSEEKADTGVKKYPQCLFPCLIFWMTDSAFFSHCDLFHSEISIVPLKTLPFLSSLTLHLLSKVLKLCH